MKREIPLSHPGEILLKDFLRPMGITQYRLAKEIGVPQRRIGQICAGQRAITPDTALRLAVFFGTDAQSWETCKHTTILSKRVQRWRLYWQISANINPWWREKSNKACRSINQIQYGIRTPGSSGEKSLVLRVTSRRLST